MSNTHIAMEWFISGVSPHVSFFLVFVEESLGTDITLVVSLEQVLSLLVINQSGSSGERTAAYWTKVGPIPSVHHHVGIALLFTRKTSLANLAFERLNVYNVSYQTTCTKTHPNINSPPT